MCFPSDDTDRIQSLRKAGGWATPSLPDAGTAQSSGFPGSSASAQRLSAFPLKRAIPKLLPASLPIRVNSLQTQSAQIT